MLTQSRYLSAQQEYAGLRKFVPATVSEQRNSPISGTEPTLSASAEHAAEHNSSITLSDINPDYAGWIRINDTAIDYPIVRGQDNEKYLDASFVGNKNPSGAIFMDSACRKGFDGSYITLHGHNMKDGSMFAGLNRYLEKDYLAKHSEIRVITPENRTRAYHIVDVKVTDIHDQAYLWVNKSRQEVRDDLALKIVSDEGKQILVLSTCINQGRKDERLLIIAQEA